MTAYYNENDAYAAAWLRNLIAAGHIAPGDVDERSITDVRAGEFAGYGQCHFFAGIGGWSLALRLAGWPDDRPVWTGSCPCQPFSAAGAGKAGDDERHLWPVWFPLIAECRPPVVFGEQVEAAIGWGWLDAVFADLEAEGYACGASVLPACGVGAPHIRQRVWFVADALRGRGCDPRDLADAAITGRGAQQERATGEDGRATPQPGRLRDAGKLGIANRPRPSAGREAAAADRYRHPAIAAGWHDCDWLPCIDGKARPVEPGTFPLAHGISGRVGLLRGAGNAICPETAAAFIQAFREVRGE